MTRDAPQAPDAPDARQAPAAPSALPVEVSILSAIEDALVHLTLLAGSQALHDDLLQTSALPGNHPSRRLDHRSYVVLRHISRHERSAQYEIAAALNVSRATLSRRVTRLEDRRLVRREPHHAISFWRHLYDRRSPWIEPTVEGHLAFENMQLLRTAFVAARLRRWSAADLRTAAALLTRLAHDLGTRYVPGADRVGPTKPARPKSVDK